jgi:hypothetical protein
MTDTSVQTKVRQVWFTSVVAIVSIAVLGLILEIALGSKPGELIDKLTRARDGSEQLRLELTLLGKLLADDPDSYPEDLVRQLAGMKLSMEAGLKLLGESGLKPENEKAFQQLEMSFRERFLPDFINFRQPYGDQDLPKIRAHLRITRNDLESRLGVFERSLIQYSNKNLKDTLQIKLMAAGGGCVLGVFGLALLWFQVQSLQKDISKAILEAAPVSGADAKMAENIAKYAGRIRELEGSNKVLRSEVDKLAPLADEVVTLRQQVSASPWETWLTVGHCVGSASRRDPEPGTVAARAHRIHPNRGALGYSGACPIAAYGFGRGRRLWESCPLAVVHLGTRFGCVGGCFDRGGMADNRRRCGGPIVPGGGS